MKVVVEASFALKIMTATAYGSPDMDLHFLGVEESETETLTRKLLTGKRLRCDFTLYYCSVIFVNPLEEVESLTSQR